VDADHLHINARSTAYPLHMMQKTIETIDDRRLVRVDAMQALYVSLDRTQQAIIDGVAKHSRGY
jgi:hypothetical protein